MAPLLHMCSPLAPLQRAREVRARMLGVCECLPNPFRLFACEDRTPLYADFSPLLTLVDAITTTQKSDMYGSDVALSHPQSLLNVTRM